MKCISLWNPWASLIVNGRKLVETRSWQTSYRGRLLIHAAQKWNGDLSSLCAREPFKGALEASGIFHVNPFTKPPGMPFGSIIGMVYLGDCIPTAAAHNVRDDVLRGWTPHPDAATNGPTGPKVFITPTEQAFGDYSPRRFAWLLSHPVLFRKPIPFRGYQRLFDVSDDLLPAEFDTPELT